MFSYHIKRKKYIILLISDSVRLHFKDINKSLYTENCDDSPQTLRWVPSWQLAHVIPSRACMQLGFLVTF